MKTIKILKIVYSVVLIATIIAIAYIVISVFVENEISYFLHLIPITLIGAFLISFFEVLIDEAKSKQISKYNNKSRTVASSTNSPSAVSKNKQEQVAKMLYQKALAEHNSSDGQYMSYQEFLQSQEFVRQQEAFMRQHQEFVNQNMQQHQTFVADNVQQHQTFLDQSAQFHQETVNQFNDVMNQSIDFSCGSMFL